MISQNPQLSKQDMLANLLMGKKPMQPTGQPMFGMAAGAPQAAPVSPAPLPAQPPAGTMDALIAGMGQRINDVMQFNGDTAAIAAERRRRADMARANQPSGGNVA